MTLPSQRSGASVDSATAPSPKISAHPTSPSSAACARFGLTPPPANAGRAKIGRASRPATFKIDEAASPPATWSRRTPAAARIRKVTPAPIASPPGTVLVTALPISSAEADANHPAPRVTSRRSAIAQTKLAASATTTSASHQGWSAPRRGHDDQVRVNAGSAT